MFNRYAYSYNDPINFLDLDGMQGNNPTQTLEELQEDLLALKGDNSPQAVAKRTQIEGQIVTKKKFLSQRNVQKRLNNKKAPPKTKAQRKAKKKAKVSKTANKLKNKGKGGLLGLALFFNSDLDDIDAEMDARIQELRDGCIMGGCDDGGDFKEGSVEIVDEENDENELDEGTDGP